MKSIIKVSIALLFLNSCNKKQDSPIIEAKYREVNNDARSVVITEKIEKYLYSNEKSGVYFIYFDSSVLPPNESFGDIAPGTAKEITIKYKNSLKETKQIIFNENEYYAGKRIIELPMVLF